MWIPAIVLLLGLAFPHHSFSSTDTLSPWAHPVPLEERWKVRIGDSIEWSRADWPDSSWTTVDFQSLRYRRYMPAGRILWFRKTVELTIQGQRAGSLALSHQPITPLEVFWDGKLVGKSGKISGPILEETLGNRLMTPIPAGLSGAGKHVIAIRASSRNRIVSSDPELLYLGEVSELETLIYRQAAIMAFVAGFMAFGALFRFLFFRTGGYGASATLFSLSLVAISVPIALESLCLFVNLEVNGYLLVSLLTGFAWSVFLILAPDYLVFAKVFPYKWVLPVMIAAGTLFSVPMTLSAVGWMPQGLFHPFLISNLLFFCMNIGVSFWAVSWAMLRKQPGSGSALTGVLLLSLSLIVTGWFKIYWAWAAGLSAHLIFLLRAQSLQIAARMREHEENRILSARLELEVLKKNIQPHFLLNTLGSIVAWLEEEPKSAILLVNALTKELEALLKVSTEKTISLEEEIRLCNLHLQVMGLRQDKQYHLECSGDLTRDRIPPMVLHTLVENGLTHGYAGKGRGRFLFRREEVPEGVRLALFNDGSLEAGQGIPREGTGFRYVRTRLEEAFPGRWSLKSGPVPDGWQVELILWNGHLSEGEYRK
jgi:hypothetical protein